jgi:hypothetical protein
MPSKPKSTGEVIAQARQDIATARLADPDEHFPYKLGAALGVLKKDAPMGPGGPDDKSATASDFMSQRIAETSAAYNEAQADYLKDPSPANRSAYEAAKDDLVAARKTHRRNRVDADGNPTGSVVALTNAGRPEHMRGVRLRRVGED